MAPRGAVHPDSLDTGYSKVSIKKTFYSFKSDPEWKFLSLILCWINTAASCVSEIDIPHSAASFTTAI